MSASENPANLDELLAQGGGEVETGVPFALRRPDLEDDRDHALTAGECAAEAGISASTASGHLAKLLDAGLLVVLVQGRHRYYNLAGSDVAEAVEALMGLAVRVGLQRTRPGPRDAAMRKARFCYDHLARALAAALFTRLV